DILITDVWVTIGFTYNKWERKYSLIKDRNWSVLCMACTKRLLPEINAFCYECKASQPLDWTTGNKDLDSFIIIMESWRNTSSEDDAYRVFPIDRRTRNDHITPSMHTYSKLVRSDDK